MTLYVYIHGFNSAFTTENPKIAELDTIGDVTGVTYDTFAPAFEIKKSLDSAISDIILTTDHDIVLVGTSLGGYWAAVMADQFGLPSVLINPSVEPMTTLPSYVGKTFTNYITGETKTFSGSIPGSYNMAIYDLDFAFAPLVLLDAADDVIPADKTAALLAAKAMITTYPGGSHKFDHMADSLPAIATYAVHCSTSF